MAAKKKSYGILDSRFDWSSLTDEQYYRANPAEAWKRIQELEKARAYLNKVPAATKAQIKRLARLNTKTGSAENKKCADTAKKSIPSFVAGVLKDDPDATAKSITTKIERAGWANRKGKPYKHGYLVRIVGPLVSKAKNRKTRKT